MLLLKKTSREGSVRRWSVRPAHFFICIDRKQSKLINLQGLAGFPRDLLVWLQSFLWSCSFIAFSFRFLRPTLHANTFSRPVGFCALPDYDATSPRLFCSLPRWRPWRIGACKERVPVTREGASECPIYYYIRRFVRHGRPVLTSARAKFPPIKMKHCRH